MASPEICIAGAGVIGLSLARSLSRSGMRVLVLTGSTPAGEASQAAAGMLAADDPHNPPELRDLAYLSRSLYPRFLDEVAADSGQRLRFQTHRTLQIVEGANAGSGSRNRLAQRLSLHRGQGVVELEEKSLDPRELAAALVASLPASHVELRRDGPVRRVTPHRGAAAGVTLETTSGRVHAGAFVDCTGAWSLSTAIAPSVRTVPRKGQMLTVTTPRSLAEDPLVLRTEDIYVVPRVHGARAGQCVIGATVEEAGFDTAVHAADLQMLRQRATDLLPDLGTSELVASWAGLRPAAPDLLPVLGPLPEVAGQHVYIASGHYRNGILLAPATAAVMSDLLLGRRPPVSLAAFSAERFASRRP